MTDNLIFWELQKTNEALTKIKEEHTFNFRMIKPTEKFDFSEPILNASKLGLIILSVYNSVFKMNRGNNQFLYGETWAKPHSDNKAISPGGYKLTGKAEIIKEETNGKVLMEPDKKYNENFNGNKTRCN